LAYHLCASWPRPAGGTRTLENRLRIELDKATAQYRAAKQNYQAALKLHAELGLGHADGAHAVRSALQQTTAARSKYNLTRGRTWMLPAEFITSGCRTADTTLSVSATGNANTEGGRCPASRIAAL
jgi:hypothetical protein